MNAPVFPPLQRMSAVATRRGWPLRRIAKVVGISVFVVAVVAWGAIEAKQRRWVSLPSSLPSFLSASSAPAAPGKAAPPAVEPRTILCVEWRQMSPGFVQSDMRCERWADGKSREQVK